MFSEKEKPVNVWRREPVIFNEYVVFKGRFDSSTEKDGSKLKCIERITTIQNEWFLQ